MGPFLQISDYLSALSTKTGLASELTSVELGDLLAAVLLLNSLSLLIEDDLNVTRVGEVGVDTTVSTVGSAALLGGLVDNNVGNVKVLDGKTLSLMEINRHVKKPRVHVESKHP
jgi:hypothetical protein